MDGGRGDGDKDRVMGTEVRPADERKVKTRRQGGEGGWWAVRKRKRGEGKEEWRGWWR